MYEVRNKNEVILNTQDKSFKWFISYLGIFITTNDAKIRAL